MDLLAPSLEDAGQSAACRLGQRSAPLGQVLAPAALPAQLLTEDGDLNRFVNVYVNGQDVRYLSGLDTPVTASDEVRLLPAMAGG